LKTNRSKGASAIQPLVCLVLLAVWSGLAVWFFYSNGALLYYGDAEAHLNIARRILDSQTPGYDQIGRIWLPLPHLLMLPLARVDELWRTGLAGAIPSAVSFVIAGTLLFAAARRVFGSSAAAASTALFAANPNLLYLQSTAMGEAIFTACLIATLYATIRFRETRSWWAVAGAGIASCLGALTRYEGWFVMPFVAGYFLWSSKKQRWVVAALYSILAVAGPLYWLAHNWWLAGDVLDFYRGPNSAMAIQGSTAYPGHGSWPIAFLYYRTAATLCAGPTVVLAGLAGAVVSLIRRAFWPLLLLVLPGVFYVWSLHSAATPIFVPTLAPNSYYNTRYGLAVLPLLAFAAGSLVDLVPAKGHVWAAALLVAIGAGYWALRYQPDHWVTWKESMVNSSGRREWAKEASEFLKPRYVRGSGIITSFGDLTAIFREAGIPLRETFTADNGVPWLAAVRRPELFLSEEWAVVMGGDDVQSAINRAGRYGIHYRLEKMIVAGTEPVLEIYRRI
jgi:hypothetical protein